MNQKYPQYMCIEMHVPSSLPPVKWSPKIILITTIDNNDDATTSNTAPTSFFVITNSTANPYNSSAPAPEEPMIEHLLIALPMRYCHAAFDGAAFDGATSHDAAFHGTALDCLTMAPPMTAPLTVVQPLIVPLKTARPCIPSSKWSCCSTPSQYSTTKGPSLREVTFWRNTKVNVRLDVVFSFPLPHCHNLKKLLTHLFLLFAMGCQVFYRPFVGNTFLVSKSYAFSLCFVHSCFSVICKEAGASDRTIHFTIISALVGGISTWGWNLHLGVGSVFRSVNSVLGFYGIFMALYFHIHCLFFTRVVWCLTVCLVDCWVNCIVAF